MANVALFRLNQIPQYLVSVNTPDYESDPDAIINPDVSLVLSVPIYYWKRVGNLVQEMTPAEKATFDSNKLQKALLGSRSAAKVLGDEIQWKALALILIDEFNIIREWLVQFKVEVAAATNLSNLQSRVATLPNMPDRTLAQLKTAYNNKIDNGLAD